jgi:polyhydroxyalkanoate synthesis regulator phasin
MVKRKHPKEPVAAAIEEVGESVGHCLSLVSAMLVESIIDVLLENGTLNRQDLQKLYADVKTQIQKESMSEAQRKMLLGLLMAKAANHKVSLPDQR